MKISVVIPHVPDIGADKYLDDLCEQLDDQVDEVLIIDNNGIGYGPAVNMGLAASTGTHIIVSNNDIRINEKGAPLKALCIWGDCVTVPRIQPEPRDTKPRCFFAMSRKVYETIRVDDYYFYDEQFFPGYFEDDDLIMRLYLHKIPMLSIDTVHIEHFNGGGHTIKQFGEQESFEANKKRYEDKWNMS